MMSNMNNFNQSYPLNYAAKGRVRIWEYHPVHGYGRLLRDVPNLITQEGASVAARAVAGVAGSGITHMYIGYDHSGGGHTTVTPTVGNTTSSFTTPLILPLTFAPTFSSTAGTGAGAVVTATLSGTSVSGFTILNGGTGYTTVPPVVISGGGGAGAGATATIAGGAVTGFTGLTGGTGYTTAPAVNILGSYTNNIAYFTTYITGFDSGRTTSLANGDFINSLGLVNTTANYAWLFSKIAVSPYVTYTHSLAVTWGLTFTASGS